jgi:hypothetical protein
MVNLDDEPEEIMGKIQESVAEHGEQGIVDVRALEMQNMHSSPEPLRRCERTSYWSVMGVGRGVRGRIV